MVSDGIRTKREQPDMDLEKGNLAASWEGLH